MLIFLFVKVEIFYFESVIFKIKFSRRRRRFHRRRINSIIIICTSTTNTITTNILAIYWWSQANFDFFRLTRIQYGSSGSDAIAFWRAPRCIYAKSQARSKQRPLYGGGISFVFEFYSVWNEDIDDDDDKVLVLAFSPMFWLWGIIIF